MAALAVEKSFPQPVAGDHDDVRCALTVASASWRRGNVGDAVTWLRRAAKAAANADDVTRALLLSKFAADLDVEPPTINESGERPTSSIPPRRSSGPPPRRSGFAPKRVSRAARRPGPPPRPSSPAKMADDRPRPSRPRAPHLAGPPPLPLTMPSAVPSAAPTLPRRRTGSDLEQTRQRMPACEPVIPPPPRNVDLASLMDDEEDVPTIIHRPAPPEPKPSEPIALETRADESGAFPSHPDLRADAAPRPSAAPGLVESRDEDTVRDRRRLHPPVRNHEDAGIPLSAARVAVVPSLHGGRPDIYFLPFGARAPEGAVTAMLVTTNARDASKLAEMMTAATS